MAGRKLSPDADGRNLPRRRAGIQTRNSIIRDYQAGLEVEQVAEKYRVSIETVRRVVADVAPPRQGGRPKHLTPAEVATAIEMRNAGESFVHIAQQLGVAYHTVYKAYQRNVAHQVDEILSI